MVSLCIPSRDPVELELITFCTLMTILMLALMYRHLAGPGAMKARSCHKDWTVGWHTKLGKPVGVAAR